MKFLFKNSFFSFLKNKVAVFLLMFIVFLTSASFTMFNSANGSFKRSYESVMKNGNRHDYTVKELYNLSGNIDFTTPTKKGAIYQLDELTPIPGATTTPAANKLGVANYEGKDYLVLNIDTANEYGFPFNGYIFIDPSKISDFISGSSIPGFTLSDGSGIINTDITGLTGLLKTNIIFDKNELIINDDFGKVTVDSTILSEINNTNVAKIFTTNSIDYQKWEFDVDNSSKDIFKNSFVNANKVFSLKVSDGTNFDAPSFDYVGNIGKAKSFKELRDLSKQYIYSNAKNELHKKLLDTLTSENTSTDEKVIYKDVNSLKVSIGTNLFKAVKESNAKVDRIRIYNGSIFDKAKTKDELIAKYTSSIEHKATKLKQDATQLMSSGKFTEGMALLQEANKLQAKIDDIKAGKIDFQYDGYKIFYTTFAATTTYVDQTSYQAVISPTYASKHGIKTISKEKLSDILNNKTLKEKMSDPNVTFDEVKITMEETAKKYGASDSLIYIGTTPVFVTGIGITPDFAFPIISQDAAIPNADSQAIVYLNDAGYSRIKSANMGSDTEDYVAFKFTHSADASVRSSILKKLQDFSVANMSWPKGINSVEKYDSKTESVLMTPMRITFLDSISNTITKITWIVTALLLAFASFIVVLVIRKQIDTRKKQLGILMANGYSKLHISISMMIISVIVVIIPSALGYITGHFMQFILVDIFGNYWTLPIWETQFSWITFTLIIGIPLIGLAIVAFLISLFSMRGTIPEILSDSSSTKSSIMNGVSRGIKFMGIKTKMSIATIFSNIGKVVIGTVAFAATIITLSISFNSVDKFSYAADASSTAREYKYEVDLVTPTDEGGLYSRQTPDSIYYSSQGIGPDKGLSREATANQFDISSGSVRTINDITKYRSLLDDFVTDSAESSPASYDNFLSFHSPSTSDSTFAWSPVIKTKPYTEYLKNRIQIKSLLDVNIQGDINPWQIASQMMPENQKNKAEIASAKFIDQTARWLNHDDPTSLTSLMSKGYIQKNVATQMYVANRVNVVQSNQIVQDYKDFIIYGLIRASQEYKKGNKDVSIPLMLTYHSILTDNTDETYTHIDVETELNNVKNNKIKKQISIRGLNENLLKTHKSMIKLSDSSVNALINKGDATAVPIIINKYFSEYYKTNNGDVIEAEVKNKTNRYAVTTKQMQKFVVVGIENTYDDNRVYTLKRYANKALGMLDMFNKVDPLTNIAKHNPLVKTQDDIFNGVFSKEDNPIIFRTSPIYAESGLYLGKNTTDMKTGSKDPQYKMIEKKYFDPAKLAMATMYASMGQVSPFAFPNPRVKTIDDIRSIYGVGDFLHPLNSAYATVEASNIADYQFNSIMKLSSALMSTIQGITMVISLAFVLLIATMIIADNKKFISTLKVMGYRNREISKIFASTFIPALAIGLAIAIPISFGVLELVRLAIMNFGHVLIPLHMAGWEIVTAFVVLILGLTVMWYISARGLKNTSLLQAFNE